MALLEVRGLTKQFGGLTAVNNVDFNAEKNSITGLIGPNGAGKTTIFNLITGVYKLSSGTILFDGKAVENKEPHQIANAGITRTFQNIRLFKKLTVQENILTACHNNATYSLLDSILCGALPEKIRGNTKFGKEEKLLKEEAEELMTILGLADRRNFKADNLPYGLQRRLEIARAMACRPKILLLDEPAAGMNPDETVKLTELIADIRKQFDVTIVLIEHHMDLVMDICDNIVVLNFGCKIAEGAPLHIQNDNKVREAYLGGGAIDV